METMQFEIIKRGRTNLIIKECQKWRDNAIQENVTRDKLLHGENNIKRNIPFLKPYFAKGLAQFSYGNFENIQIQYFFFRSQVCAEKTSLFSNLAIIFDKYVWRVKKN